MNLIKYDEQNQSGENLPAANVQTMEGFNKMLNEEVPENDIEINKFAGNSKYLPISYIQMLLDQFFVGLWETENFTYTVVANELIGNVTLKYYHPFAKVWLKREGAAAVMIQQNKGANITDISEKIKNTLAKDHPHLLAACICSAARSIGKRFGRDLNRKLEDNYDSFYSDMAAAESVTATIEWEKVLTLADLKNIWNANPDLHNNKQFIKTFTYHKNKIKK